MTHINCRETAKNRDQLRNPTLGNRVWTTFTCRRDETTSEATLSAHLIAVWSLEPPRVLIPDNNFIGSAVSAQPMVVTDRQTDRPRCVGNNRPRLLCTALGLTRSLLTTTTTMTKAARRRFRATQLLIAELTPSIYVALRRRRSAV